MSVDSTRKEQLHMIRVPPDCPRLSIGPRLNVRQFVVFGACDEARVIEHDLCDALSRKAGDLQGDEHLHLRWTDDGSVAPSERESRCSAGPISAQRHLCHHRQTCRDARHLQERDTHERTGPQDAPGQPAFDVSTVHLLRRVAEPLDRLPRN